MLTNVSSNQTFKGFLRIEAGKEKEGTPSKSVSIIEEKLNDKGKAISYRKLPNLTLNTDKIRSVNSEIDDYDGLSEPDEETCVKMSDGTQYILRNVSKDDFDSFLNEAMNTNHIVDILA